MASKKKAPKLVIINSQQDVQAFYANFAEVTASNLDFQIKLGLIDSHDEKETRVQGLFVVYMSPEHTRSFLNLLQRKMLAYDLHMKDKH